MQAKEKRSLKPNALFVTQSPLTELDQWLKVPLETQPPLKKVSPTRKYYYQPMCFNYLFLYRQALKDKGGKWTEKNLDKYLKSPADYAPGKYLI